MPKQYKDLKGPWRFSTESAQFDFANSMETGVDLVDRDSFAADSASTNFDMLLNTLELARDLFA